MPDTNPTVYFAHGGHENDCLYTENVVQYLTGRGIECKIIELNPLGQRPELEQCFTAKPLAVFGYNSQLDHSWISSESFLDGAACRNIPVVQWIVDHPCARWSEFNASTRRNSGFLFNTRYSEAYFRRYCLPGAITGVIRGVGPAKYSRIETLCRDGFLARDIRCIIPVSLARVKGTVEQTMAEIGLLDDALAKAVNAATAAAQFELIKPLEEHLIAAFADHNLVVNDSVFNTCFWLVEESVQAFRRIKIFEIARDYPVLIQSDPSAIPFLQGCAATVATNVSTRLTLERMRSCRAVVCPSPLNDMIHDRADNALNAGCVAIVEDNLANREVFSHGKNALIFRYEDSSLRECLDIVCYQPECAYTIAEAGMMLRDTHAFALINSAICCRLRDA